MAGSAASVAGAIALALTVVLPLTAAPGPASPPGPSARLVWITLSPAKPAKTDVLAAAARLLRERAAQLHLPDTQAQVWGPDVVLTGPAADQEQLKTLATCRAPAASSGHYRDRDDERAVLLVRCAERSAHGQIVRCFHQEVLYVHVNRLLLLPARSCRADGASVLTDRELATGYRMRAPGVPGHPASILPPSGCRHQCRTPTPTRSYGLPARPAVPAARATGAGQTSGSHPGHPHSDPALCRYVNVSAGPGRAR